MIAHLRGQLAASGADHAVIDVNGVGYLVGASAKMLEKLGVAGDTVTIHTEMLVSEDSIRLMGFAEANERWDSAGVALRAEADDGGYRLSGVKHLVQDATVADVVLVTARTFVRRLADGR